MVSTVAQVIIDLDVPHLDRPFDYHVPSAWLHKAKVGSLVRVKWGAQRHNGWIIGLKSADEVEETDFSGQLSPIIKVLSIRPLFNKQMLETYRYLALRHGATLSQVLSIAIPARRAKVEANLPQIQKETTDFFQDAPASITQVYPEACVDSISLNRFESADDSRPFRISALAVPHTVPDQLLALLADYEAKNTPVILVLPTFAQAKELHQWLLQVAQKPGQRKDPSSYIGLLASEMPETSRYRNYLLALQGSYRIVVGTRSAVWTPFHDRAVIVIWDEGSDLYRERRTPKTDVLDVAVARSIKEQYSMIVCAYSRSIKTEALVESGWAVDLVPDRALLRRQVPRVRVVGSENFEQEGGSSFSLLPDSAFQLIRKSLSSGPVLIQVGSAGRKILMDCPQCGFVPPRRSLLMEKEKPNPRSTSTEVGVPSTVCADCGGNLPIIEVGAERIGRELGRAFPSTSVVVSASSSLIRREISDRPQIVVATSGAEPRSPSGYSTVVISEPEVTVYRDALGAEEGALHQWMNALALCRPGHVAMICGDIPSQMSQALVRWTPVEFARQQLSERVELGFFPARWWVAIEGESFEVAKVVDELESDKTELSPGDPPLEFRGTLSLGQIKDTQNRQADSEGSETALFAADLVTVSSEMVRTLVTCQPNQVTSLMAAIRAIINRRSLQKEMPLKISVNPPDAFET